MSYKTSNISSRIYGLDIFRAIAILLVVYGHGGGITGGLFDFIPAIPLPDGVELFFVLSGFLIGGILIKLLNKPTGFHLKDLAVFWKRRWFRTLPNYYLILLVNIYLVKNQIIDGDYENFNYKFFFFLQNFKEGFLGFFWESWSLAVEEWFYIIAPIFLLLFSKLFPIKDTILLTILALIFIPLFYRISISDVEVDAFWWGIHFKKVVLTRLDAIMYGVLMAFLKYYHSNFWYTYRNWLFAIGLILMYIVIFVPHHPNDGYSKTLFFSIYPLGAALLLAKVDSIKNYRYKWLGKSITHISLISYSMYLVNLALVSQVIMKNSPPTTYFENAYLYLLYWSATIGISTLIYFFFEKPMTKLRDRF